MGMDYSLGCGIWSFPFVYHVLLCEILTKYQLSSFTCHDQIISSWNNVDFPIADSSLFQEETGIIIWRSGKGYKMVKKGEGSLRCVYPQTVHITPQLWQTMAQDLDLGRSGTKEE